MHSEVADLLHQHRALRLRDVPHLAGSIDGLCRRGQLTRVLPGVVTATVEANDPGIRALALTVVDPDAVVTGEFAAKLTFWPEADTQLIAAYRSGNPSPAPGWSWIRGTPPADLIRQRGSVRYTAPELTVLDLVPSLGGSIIDRALRGGVPLAAMYRALESTPNRRGNRRRQELLRDSRDEPWSEAERQLHLLLRAAKIIGWRTNVRIGAATGPIADVAWLAERVIVEIDGWDFHNSRVSFESDRWRDACLVGEDWVVLRFTWWQLQNTPEKVIAIIAETLARRRRRLRR